MEFEALFEGSAVEKWKEIVLNASPYVVGKELERLLEELARYELSSENKKIEPKSLEAKKQDLAIESMGNILSQSE